ncbi:NeuD/PglB/VioB family sugar acetyltransferase [Sphingomonas phyllosphaerae]|uniref:NeuD/PglB/VioB family sugar acetyltransferase n=1 Tax=Sphingomonas phyllosphaerae TaxID=257003 RepID=UPI0003B4511B
MRDYILWGATGQARVLIELLAGQSMQLVALVDRAVAEPPLPGVTMLRDAEALDTWLNEREAPLPGALVAIGGHHGAERRRLQQALQQRGVKILCAIHRAAYVATDAMVGAGSQVLAGSVVAARAQLGEAVIVNTGVTVDHDCVIDAGVHLAPGVTLAGEIMVGRDAFVGAGATVLPRLRIGAGAIVGAGAVVTRDVVAGATVVGVPARAISASGSA